MFGFSIVKPPFSFTDIKTITIPKGKTDYHCKIKETLYIQELEPAFNVNVGSEKLMLY